MLVSQIRRLTASPVGSIVRLIEQIPFTVLDAWLIIFAILIWILVGIL